MSFRKQLAQAAFGATLRGDGEEDEGEVVEMVDIRRGDAESVQSPVDLPSGNGEESGQRDE